MNLKNKLAIFDLDGTLFDTKDVNYNAYQNAIKMIGIGTFIDYNDFCNLYNGKNYRDFLPKIIPNTSEEQMKNIHNLKKDIYINYLDKAKKNNLLFAVIQEMKKSFFISIVTNASKKNVDDILEKFSVKDLFDLLIKSLTKINEDFDPLVIANIVELKCLKFLGVEPNLEYKCGICGKNEVSTISVDNACYVCKSCLANEYKYSEKSLKVLKLYSLVDFENLKTINVSNKVKEEIDNFLDMYYDEYTGIYLKTKDFIKKIS